MAKNVNDRGLIENGYGVIEQRASTNAGKMERRIMEEQSDSWEDGKHVDGENSKAAEDDTHVCAAGAMYTKGKRHRDDAV